MLGTGASDERFINLGKNVVNRMTRNKKNDVNLDFPNCSRAALALICCSAPAATTPAAAGAAAAASPGSVASARTPVPQREHTMPVEAYEAVIELTGQLAEVTGDLDECTQLALSLRDQLAAEVTRRKLAEAAEAAACKRADACEREANKGAKAAIKEAREECRELVIAAREQQGIAEREKVHSDREPAALQSEMRKLEAAHDKALAEQVTESARMLARQLREINVLTRERDDLEVKFADACAKLLVAKDEASATTTAAEAATRDATQLTRRLVVEERNAAANALQAESADKRAAKLATQLEVCAKLGRVDAARTIAGLEHRLAAAESALASSKSSAKLLKTESNLHDKQARQSNLGRGAVEKELARCQLEGGYHSPLLEALREVHAKERAALSSQLAEIASELAAVREERDGLARIVRPTKRDLKPKGLWSAPHKAAVTAAAIVAGSVYTPSLAAFEVVEGEGVEGALMLPVVVQQIFLWTQDAAVDSTAVFKGETAIFELESFRSPPATLTSAIGSVASWERRGKHSSVFVINQAVKALVELAFGKFSEVFWHHTYRFQQVAINPEDPAWKRAGGELATITRAQATKLANAFFTGNAVESCQGAVKDTFASMPGARPEIIGIRAAAARNKSALWLLKLPVEAMAVRMEVARREGKKRARVMGTAVDALRASGLLTISLLRARTEASKRRADEHAQLVVRLASTRVTTVRALLSMSVALLKEQRMAFKLLDGRKEVVNPAKGPLLRRLAAWLVKAHGQSAMDCTSEELDVAANAKAASGPRVAGAAGGKRKRRAEHAYEIDSFLDVRFNEVTGQREYLAEWAPGEEGQSWPADWLAYSNFTVDGAEPSDELKECIAELDAVTAEAEGARSAVDEYVNALVAKVLCDGESVLVVPPADYESTWLVGTVREVSEQGVTVELEGGSAGTQAYPRDRLVSTPPALLPSRVKRHACVKVAFDGV
ncbi:hypothetical protein T492DRAFT_210412 [Pavlovales sp. CCMP2436]|nr:hypothetical protein T492DRAFT_210412 [Pavlovales sp. CCMP2436]